MVRKDPDLLTNDFLERPISEMPAEVSENPCNVRIFKESDT